MAHTPVQSYLVSLKDIKQTGYESTTTAYVFGAESKEQAIQAALNITFENYPHWSVVEVTTAYPRKRGKCDKSYPAKKNMPAFPYLKDEDGFYTRENSTRAEAIRKDKVGRKFNEGLQRELDSLAAGRTAPLTGPPPKDIIQQISGVPCQGCGKKKTIVTHTKNMNLGFCGACNMRLIRAFGQDYGTTLDNPAASLRALVERKQAKKDNKAVRKIKYQLLNLMDGCDFEQDRIKRVLAEFADVFSGLE